MQTARSTAAERRKQSCSPATRRWRRSQRSSLVASGGRCSELSTFVYGNKLFPKIRTPRRLRPHLGVGLSRYGLRCSRKSRRRCVFNYTEAEVPTPSIGLGPPIGSPGGGGGGGFGLSSAFRARNQLRIKRPAPIAAAVKNAHAKGLTAHPSSARPYLDTWTIRSESRSLCPGCSAPRHRHFGHDVDQRTPPRDAAFFQR